VSEGVVAAAVELKKVYAALAADLEEARRYGQDNPTAHAQRSLFRTAFSLMEGMAFQLRSVSLACAEELPKAFETSEIALLKEERYFLDKRGIPKVSADFQTFRPGLLFSMRCYAKAYGTFLNQTSVTMDTRHSKNLSR
jgi:hypothetical protein